MVLKGHEMPVWGVTVTPGGKRAVSASADGTLKVWDLSSGKNTATFKGHKGRVNSVAVTPDGKRAVSASADGTLKVWELQTKECRATWEGHTGSVNSVIVTPDGNRVISGSDDKTLKVWNLTSGTCLATMVGHTNSVGYWAVAVFPDGKRAVSGSYDNTLKVWDIVTGSCLSTLEGHTGTIHGVAISPDGKMIVSGSSDRTLKVWELQTKECRATWEGHTGSVNSVAVTSDGNRVISGSDDKTLKVWDLQTGRCLATLEGHTDNVLNVAIIPNSQRAISTSFDDTLRVWELSVIHVYTGIDASPTSRYTNAKVVLVGETGTGKTGLAIRLTEDRWQVTPSTHGMEVRPLNLPQLNNTDISREVWLWDFAGQPDYRLIHQLYMDETALALMVMDPQKDDPFESLGHWEKALKVALKRPFNKVLVAGRCDRGGMTVSRQKIEQYINNRGYKAYIDTSAKTGDNCDTLKAFISEHIPWDHLPYTATTILFKSLKDAIITIKNEGAVIIRIFDLILRLKDRLKDITFTEAELRATVGLLAGQGLIHELDFGDYVLLHPEHINNYASVVVRCARESTDEMGSVSKTAVLEGILDYKGMKRLEPTDEKILLRAMLQTLTVRALCLEEETPEGTQLVFPSYFKRDRPVLMGHPAVLTTYVFTGPIDEIYATLVVRLFYTNDFDKDHLWKNAADFKTLDGKQAGFLLTKKADDTAELEVYFQQGVEENTKVSFIKYIHEHLLKRTDTVERHRSYVCPYCNTPVENRKALELRLEKGFKDIFCSFCGKTVQLIDSIELKFASLEFLAKARAMEEEANRKLDNESLELILVGQATAITAEAGHIYRGYTNSDHGIDAEIEFKDREGMATGRRVYLQLKSGDSYLKTRKKDGKEIFYIKKKRWAKYWVSQAYPVMLVIRTSDNVIRWMNVTEYLKAQPGTKQVEFDGEPFTKDSLRKLTF
jgi:small GTP-binding protein